MSPGTTRKLPCLAAAPSLAVLAASIALAAGTAGGAADDPLARGNRNPLLPGYFADPTVRKFGDTFYIYATTDGTGGGRGPSQVWTSRDFVHWTNHPMSWPATPYIWAPDVVGGDDGRYYFYYSEPCRLYGGAGETPFGPWKPLVPGDGVVVPDRLVPEVITLDGQTFRDDDGSWYLYWGTWGIFPKSGCGVGKLNPDMKSFSKLGLIPNTEAIDFFEGPFVFKRNGIYYLTYSSGSCHDHTYRVQYAMGASPFGPFKMGPVNPILASTADRTVHGPGHHSILLDGEGGIIVYHRHDVPYSPNGMHRQVAADRLRFAADGSILPVEPTHRGVGLLGPDEDPSPDLAAGKSVKASSWYRDELRRHEFRP